MEDESVVNSYAGTDEAIVINDVIVEALLGVPFSWQPLHTLDGNLVIILLVVLLLAPEYRKRALL